MDRSIYLQIEKVEDKVKHNDKWFRMIKKLEDKY